MWALISTNPSFISVNQSCIFMTQAFISMTQAIWSSAVCDQTSSCQHIHLFVLSWFLVWDCFFWYFMAIIHAQEKNKSHSKKHKWAQGGSGESTNTTHTHTMLWKKKRANYSSFLYRISCYFLIEILTGREHGHTRMHNTHTHARFLSLAHWRCEQWGIRAHFLFNLLNKWLWWGRPSFELQQQTRSQKLKEEKIFFWRSLSELKETYIDSPPHTHTRFY